jgi:dTMP kinase
MHLKADAEKTKSHSLFVTFEGGEGSGKSVQCAKLHERFVQTFPDTLAVRTREPGGSSGAEMIRHMLLTGENERWYPVSEVLLFYAARYDHWRRTILPILLQGGVVFCDRFFDSSVVYQGEGRGISANFFEVIHEMFNDPTRSFVPDRTYVLDIDPIEGVNRSKTRISQQTEKEDRFECIDIEFHHRIRQGYLQILKRNPTRCVKIEGNRSVEDIHDEIWNDFRVVLGE